MPKGYIISRVDITDPDAYARYAAAATKAIAEHGGKPLARGGRTRRSRARRERATSCSNSRATTRRVAIFIPSNIRRRGRCAKARRTSKWCWSRESDACRRATGSSMSTYTIPKATRNTSRPMRPPSRNTGRAFWFAAASMSSPRGKRGAPVVIEFRDYETARRLPRFEEYREAGQASRRRQRRRSRDRRRLRRPAAGLTRWGSGMADLRLIVSGAAGRMGRMVIRAIHETDGFTLTGALEREDSPWLGQDSGAAGRLSGEAAFRSSPIRCRCCSTPTRSSISRRPPPPSSSPALAAQARIAARDRHDRA